MFTVCQDAGPLEFHSNSRDRSQILQLEVKEIFVSNAWPPGDSSAFPILILSSTEERKSDMGTLKFTHVHRHACTHICYLLYYYIHQLLTLFFLVLGNS